VQKALDVELEALGAAAKVLQREPLAVRVQEVVHQPERSLRGGRPRGFGRPLRVGRHVGERAVTEDVAQPVPVPSPERALGLSAIAALEVAVLDDRHGASCGPRTWSRCGSTSAARSRRRPRTPPGGT